MIDSEWVYCPFCNSKTRLQVQEDTVLLNYPLLCPKCKKKCLINVKQMNITVIREPVIVTQSRDTSGKTTVIGSFFIG